MDLFKTHGAFSWAELATSDPPAAASFYGRLLGWQFDSMPQESGAYRVIKAGGEAVGGMMKASPGAVAQWGCYITVQDLGAVVAQCEALGGRVLLPPADIPTVGRLAVLQDPQGAVFNVICYDDQPAPR